MKTLISAPAIVLCGTLSFFAGCASGPDSHVVSAPPPGTPQTVVTTAPAAAPAAPMIVQTPANGTNPPATIVVTQAPPAPQPVAQAAIAQPSSQHVWVDGYWTWRNNRYEWMAGHWEVPPRYGAVWVAPRYEREGSAFRFYEGYWN